MANAYLQSMNLIPNLFPKEALFAAFTNRFAPSKDNIPETELKNAQLWGALHEIPNFTGQLVRVKQVHGNNVLRTEHPGIFEGFDAVVSNQKGLFLAIAVADCTPIMIWDSKKEAIGVIHAGWRGTVDGIVENTFRMMAESYGTQASNCYVFVGPCISEKHFEVDADVADFFTSDFKNWDSIRNKWMINLKEKHKKDLISLGVKQENIEIAPHCTFGQADFYSYRREKGLQGRNWALMALSHS